ncbi:hypothetical protein [Alicyclobacillus sp. SP_1]|uniref:hypothetical protein n=1 Tax=Alicyclobacillus sp. SP_1 TaxID=2942475 RepID=UPI0021573EFE|nr:hypothetical protein [Alicyclobacillus sp. SP_1]
MHTTAILGTSDFSYRKNGKTATFDELFPEFNERDRIGIVTRSPGGSVGASALLLAAITRFYDFYRPLLGNEPGKLRIYPDYFIFHVGQKQMDHYWMDIWPPNKEVVVEDDPEEILESINDRGITRLLVEDITPSQPTLLRGPKDKHRWQSDTSSPILLAETVASAEQRMVTALAYHPTGQTAHPDVCVTSCQEAERYIRMSIEESENLRPEEREALHTTRDALYSNGQVSESYRSIAVAQAICMLTQSTTSGPATRRHMAKW